MAILKPAKPKTKIEGLSSQNILLTSPCRGRRPRKPRSNHQTPVLHAFHGISAQAHRFCSTPCLTASSGGREVRLTAGGGSTIM